jgi:isoquinoline 1-oxidoreductase alpha subunit
MLMLTVNGKEHVLDDVDGTAPLLWVLRDTLNLVGTKYGCGIGQCGACTVLIDGAPVRSCSFNVAAAAEHAITTVEGLSAPDAPLHPLQQAWIDVDVAQCGYCQAGQLMSATALLASNNDPSDADIDQAMAGNLCRCGTYLRLRQAIHAAAAVQRGEVAKL